MTKGEKKKLGRPSKYKPEFAEQARKLCLLGATDSELADFFEVDEATIYRWKNEFEDFCESIKKGKVLADAEIADKLYHRALGYSHKEDDIRAVNGEIIITPTVKHYPPDATSAIFWLKNRQKSKWRDKQEIDHQSSNGSMSPKQTKDLTDDELEVELAKYGIKKPKAS